MRRFQLPSFFLNFYELSSKSLYIHSMKKEIRRPDSSEYDPFYRGYVEQVPGNNFYKILEELSVSTPAFLTGLHDDQWNYRYQPGKWSIREMVLHMIDTEQIFCYRALRLARGDKTHLPGFDQDPYVVASEANTHSADSLVAQYQAVRNVTLHRFRHFSDTMLGQVGTVSGGPQSVLAIGFIMAGHELHHLEVMRQKYGIG